MKTHLIITLVLFIGLALLVAVVGADSTTPGTTLSAFATNPLPTIPKQKFLSETISFPQQLPNDQSLTPESNMQVDEYLNNVGLESTFIPDGVFTAAWSKTYGGFDVDKLYSIQQTSDGGYIAAGDTQSYGAGSVDAWILKLDAAGGIEWQKTFGGLYSHHFESIQQTSDGGYIAAGSAHLYGAGSVDAWILKLDTTGNVIWEKTYGSLSDDRFSSIQQTSDDGYIVAGLANSTEYTNDAWILKLDSTGEIEWEKTYSTAKNNGVAGFTSIQQTLDGGYVAIGNTYIGGSSEAWILKLDAEGNVVWQKTFGGTDFDLFKSIQQTSDGGYIVGGDTYSYGAGSVDAWILKLGENGEIPGCASMANSNAIVTNADSNVTITSSTVTIPIATVNNSNAFVSNSSVSIETVCQANLDPCMDMSDLDEDGLPNGWEMCGYYHNRPPIGAPDVDLRALGANPEIRDIFIEVDWMDDPSTCTADACFHTHEPHAGAMRRIVEAFEDNPYEEIHVHIDYGSEAPLTYSDQYETWGELPNGSGGNRLDEFEFLFLSSGTWDMFRTVKLANFTPTRWDLFHYAVFGHRLIDGAPGVIGGSRIHGSDIAIGIEGRRGTVQEQAIALMHELGHNLGLCHDGPREFVGDCEIAHQSPNFLSIMNYLYAHNSGLYRDDLAGGIDYSGPDDLSDELYEKELNEQEGLQNEGPNLSDYQVVWRGINCPLDDNYSLPTSATGSIDWNCNNTINSGTISSDLNAINGVNDTLRTYNEWVAIRLDVGCIGLGSDCIQDAKSTNLSSVDIWDAFPDIPTPYAVEFAGSGLLIARPGESPSFSISITNHGYQTTTVDINRNYVGSWFNLNNVPNNVSLTPGQVVTYQVLVTVPSGVDTAQFQKLELEAYIGTSPLMGDILNVAAQVGPYAWFEATTPTIGTQPLTVNFEDLSVGEITSLQWSFGDGVISIQQNPTHTYISPGIYTVSLMVSGPDGSHTHTREGLVIVSPNTVYLPIIIQRQ